MYTRLSRVRRVVPEFLPAGMAAMANTAFQRRFNHPQFPIARQPARVGIMPAPNNNTFQNPNRDNWFTRLREGIQETARLLDPTAIVNQETVRILADRILDERIEIVNMIAGGELSGRVYQMYCAMEANPNIETADLFDLTHDNDPTVFGLQ